MFPYCRKAIDRGHPIAPGLFFKDCAVKKVRLWHNGDPPSFNFKMNGAR